MVYINLSVTKTALSVAFYCDALGLFSTVGGGRLICTAGPELIIDLVEIGTEDHLETFGVLDHVPSSFWIHAVTDEPGAERTLHLTSRLEAHRIPYDLTGNIAGSYLRLVDPSGNKFCIHTNCGDIA
jgi:catechol 2,3-dioxygenase-like lactoylglutathione lyase family enzyme